MVSVTNRVKQVKQPRGGYISPKELIVVDREDGKELYGSENIHSILVGLAVDYLTRFSMGTPKEIVFKIAIFGSKLVNKYDHAMELLEGVTGLDSKSINNVCKLAGFDSVFRAGVRAYKPVQSINADNDTISNIKTMVDRSVLFWDDNGPIIKDGFTFEGGYTETVSTGDGDFLTESTVWDFKVSKNDPTNKHTLQLLMYYLMGKHSVHDEFQHIKQLGIFNPRLNKVYLLKVNNISEEVISEVSTEVIGY
ncbi:hypothetical protein OPHB3_3247 [Oceanobacillus picturae]|uniref:Uncharacterized protein n=1 Tax=Oceanobacillus picturae TaxID=171693 RepID=A0A0U9H994_9BACI|nr:hypothetical protein [Oceanobacillus picturae]GAQ19285.1 hypothetical protein OPHB3_3247 [Oceanobacillus picturae]